MLCGKAGCSESCLSGLEGLGGNVLRKEQRAALLPYAQYQVFRIKTRE